MRHQDHNLVWGLYLFFVLSLSVCGVSSDTPGDHHDDTGIAEMFTKDELGDKIKDLLENRPERADGPDMDMDFEELFGELDSLVTGMPDDFEFDVSKYGPSRPIRHQEAKKCLDNPQQFQHFLNRVHKALEDLREDYLDDLQDSRTMDDDMSMDNDTTTDTDSNDSTPDDDDSMTTEAPDSRMDDRDTTDMNDMTDDAGDAGDAGDGMRRKRAMGLEGFDLDEVLDNLEEEDVECLMGFISVGDEKFLCRRYSQRSSGIFTKVMTAGADCDDYLLENDDDPDDDVSEDVAGDVRDGVDDVDTDGVMDDILVMDDVLDEVLDDVTEDNGDTAIEEITDDILNEVSNENYENSANKDVVKGDNLDDTVNDMDENVKEIVKDYIEDNMNDMDEGISEISDSLMEDDVTTDDMHGVDSTMGDGVVEVTDASDKNDDTINDKVVELLDEVLDDAGDSMEDEMDDKTNDFVDVVYDLMDDVTDVENDDTVEVLNGGMDDDGMAEAFDGIDDMTESLLVNNDNDKDDNIDNEYKNAGNSKENLKDDATKKQMTSSGFLLHILSKDYDKEDRGDDDNEKSGNIQEDTDSLTNDDDLLEEMNDRRNEIENDKMNVYTHGSLDDITNDNSRDTDEVEDELTNDIEHDDNQDEIMDGSQEQGDVVEDILDDVGDTVGDRDESREREETDQRRTRLNEGQQRAILNRFMKQESGEWSDDDVEKVLRLAPDVIDDDFLDDLPQELFRRNLRQFGRMATRRGGNPSLRYALREKLEDLIDDSMTVDDIREIGPGLLSLRFDQIQSLNGRLLLEADIDDIFDDDSKDQDSLDQDDDDDDRDDDDDDVRLAIARRMKEAIKAEGLNKQHIGRAMRFLKDDMDFLNMVEPDDLLDSLDDIRDIEYDDDDVRSVFQRMSQSPRFPPPASMTGQNLTHFGHLLRGMGVSHLAQLRKDAIEDALDTIKDIDFDDDQAEEILEDILDANTQVENFAANDVRRLGKLMRGMPTAHLQKMKDDVVEDLLDDLDDLGLNDAQKRIIAAKARINNKLSPKFLELDDFADVVSLDDLDEFDDNEIKTHMSISSRIRWRLPQAAMLANMYKRANGAKRLRPSDLAQMGMVARGLLPDDLDDMVETQDDVLDLAEELKDMQEDLTSGQIDELVESFNEISDLDNKEVEIDESEAMQGANMLAYLSPDHFAKLDFTAPGMNAFVSQVAKMSSNKMARDHVQFLARTMLDMMEEVDDDSTSKKEQRESRRLRSLGQMALGLTPSQISGFSGQAIIDNLDILRTLPLTKAQSQAVLDRVEDAVDDWECRSDILARVGPLLQHYDGSFSDDCEEELLGSMSAIMEGLEKRREMVKERLEEGFERENDDATDSEGERRLVNAMVLAASKTFSVRRKRAVAEGSLTCDVVTQLRSSASMVDIKMLESMKEEEFKNCLATLGAISHWSDEALSALARKTKMVYNGVNTWSNEIIRRAGSIIAGLSLAEIQQLQLTGVDAMNSIAKHARLSEEQLKAGFRTWMSVTGKMDVTAIPDGEFAALSEFVCGLEIGDINKLDATTFKRAIDVIGHATSCSPEQREAYLAKAMSVYGSQVEKWSPAVVGDMGHLLSALNAQQIKKLTHRQLSLITPVVIKHLPKEGVAAMSSNQLIALSTNQANAVTQAQYEALGAEQKKSLDAKATVDFQQKGVTPDGKGNGAAEIAYSAVLTVTTVLFIRVLI